MSLSALPRVCASKRWLELHRHTNKKENVDLDVAADSQLSACDG